MNLSSDTPVPSSPLFILSVATGYGGAERDIEILLPYLAAGRKVVVFACSSYHLERLSRIERPGLEIHRIDASRDGFVEAGARLFVQRYFALRPSAILANTLDSLRILAHAASDLPGLDVQSCFYVRDFQWFDHVPLLQTMARATLLVPDRSVLEKPDYIGQYAWPNGPLRALVMPNPVDIPPAASSALPVDAPFLHLATVNGFKGHRRLADAAAILHRNCPGLRIESHGHRPIPALYEQLCEHIDAVGAAQTLVLHEHVVDPSALLRQARAVLVTSISEHGGPETFGRTLIEAWAHGRPVIAFACGAPAHLVRHEIDGLLVNEGDVEGLAAAMARLHHDPALADRLGRNGRERAEREFAPGVVLRQLLPVLEGQWCPQPAASLRPPTEDGPVTLFDVSLSLMLGWHSPVGMLRVEKDLGELLALQRTPVQLVRHGADDGGYRRLTARELEFLANRHDGRDGIGMLAARELATTPLPPPRLPLSVGRSLRLLGRLHLARGVHGVRGAGGRRLSRWLRGRAESAVRSAPIDAARFAPGAGDALLSVSNPWDYVGLGAFQALRARGVRIVLAVHDLMVWETPQWTAGRDPRDHAANMLPVLAEADRLVAVSQHTAKVVAQAFASIDRSLPPMRIAHPAGLSSTHLPFGGPPPGLDPTRPFVVYCSTIEVRKNHLLLLHLWERLRQSLPPERLPVLVIAGRWGWGVEPVRLAVERNWRLASHVHVAQELRDEQLLWLYRHARFAVFPSFNEGFGLPVAEALAVGTPVVVSDHPALVEASGGAMPAIDAGDLPAWQREVAALCLDDARLEQLRARAQTCRVAAPDELPRALADAAGLAP
ncbi:glycosyltransferase family 4 protein [Variovorax boronicumulans]|uniref:glycosyltransferase family 4 protein n=1 Tax=Variovorax boronicumulans TaxID=436515 RepID=UPI001C56F894